jgi:hypothetical protein
MLHDDLRILDSNSSQQQESQIQRSSQPFYLLNYYPLEPPVAADSTNLVDY